MINCLNKLKNISMSVKWSVIIFLLLALVSWVIVIFTGGLPLSNTLPVYMWGLGCGFACVAFGVLLLVWAKLVKWSDRIK
jgi:protein-S-isoprenylcysteine O-methyltransferase Ste14